MTSRLKTSPLAHVRRIENGRDFHFPQNKVSFTFINLKEVERPSTWTMTTGDDELPLCKVYKKVALSAIHNTKPLDEDCFIDVGHDGLGRRKYLSFNEAIKRRKKGRCTVFGEDDLRPSKELRNFALARFLFIFFLRVSC
jgi:hypothetical protein